jgi:hypothetical protein
MLLCPLTAQMCNVHFHLVALRWQEHPHESFRAAAAACNPMLRSTIAARMLRIAPGYGMGGMINVRVRDYMQKRADPSLALTDGSTTTPAAAVSISAGVAR